MSNEDIIVRKLLERRGIPADARERFLNPLYEHDLHDPFLMKGMELAVRRLIQAIKKKERIMVFGDYDADGVPGTALLIRAFNHLGVQVKPYIPNRTTGYGLSDQIVTRLVAEKCQLLITVDNGTVAHREIAASAEAGIDVIVCDHHQPQAEKLADKAYAILNPHQADCPYPFKELCGCAIAWKLMIALYRRLGKEEGPLKWELDLVALATIADMVPLLGENRVLAHYGLKVLAKSRNLGLRELVTVSGIKLTSLSAADISFRLAPRINAPSRMHHDDFRGENASLNLLLTSNPSEAQALAQFLNQQNAERQALLKEHLAEAMRQAEEQKDQSCLIVYQADWSTGLIGLIAGKLAEKYNRPVIALAKEGDRPKGSVRSVEGIDAVEWLSAASEFLEQFGGHQKAAGLTLRGEEQLDNFRRQVAQTMAQTMAQTGKNLAELEKAAGRKPDLILSLSDVTMDLSGALSSLEPFGVGFPAPLFSSDVQIRERRLVGGEKQHLSLVVEQKQVLKKAIGFNLGPADIQIGQRYRIYYQVEAEEWSGTSSVSCKINRILPIQP